MQAMPEVKSTEESEKPKLILAVDFDGPLNDFNDEYMHAQGDTPRETIDAVNNLGGVNVQSSQNPMNSIHIGSSDISYLSPIFESLARHGVKVICGSQRITLTGNDAVLRENMYSGIEQAFGTQSQRNFLIKDDDFDASLTLHSETSAHSKNVFLERAREFYGTSDTPVILMDDDLSYAKPTEDGNFGFVHVPSAYGRGNEKTKQTLLARSSAYVKVWLESLSQVMTPETLRDEIAAKAHVYAKEFDWLLENDQSLKTKHPRHYAVLEKERRVEKNRIEQSKAIVNLCDEFLAGREEKKLSDEGLVVLNIKKVLTNNALPSKDRIKNTEKIFSDRRTKILMQESSKLTRFFYYFSARMKAIRSFESMQKETKRWLLGWFTMKSGQEAAAKTPEEVKKEDEKEKSQVPLPPPPTRPRGMGFSG